MKKIIILSLILMGLNKNSQGQLNKHFMFIDNQYQTIDSNATYLVDFKAKEINDKIYLIWKTINDTVPGCYMVFKSNNFEDFKYVSVVKIVNQIKPNISIANYVQDKYDCCYNFYHLVRVKTNNFIFDASALNIKDSSIANIEIDPNEKEQEFTNNNKNKLANLGL